MNFYRMRRAVIHLGGLLLLMAPALGVRAQTVLGKHPSDIIVPGFLTQNNNADTLMSGLNKSHVLMTNLDFGIISSILDQVGGPLPVTRLGTNAVISPNTGTNWADFYGFKSALTLSNWNTRQLELPYHGTTINEALLMRTYQQLNPVTHAGPFKVLVTGDSKMSTDQSPFPMGTVSILGRYMQFGGSLGGFGNGASGNTFSTGVTGNPPDTNWYCTHYTIPPGGCLTNAFWTAYTGSLTRAPMTNADTVSIGVVTDPNYSSDLRAYVMTTWAGPLTQVGTINCQSARGFYGTNILYYGTYYTVITNADPVNPALVLWDNALINNGHTYQYFSFPAGGQMPALGWNTVDDVIFTNAIQFLSPSLVLAEDNNDLPSYLATNADHYLARWKSVLGTNADMVCISPTMQTNGDLHAMNNMFIRAACISNQVAYIDVGNEYPSNLLRDLGWYIDGVHINQWQYKIPATVWAEIFAQMKGIDFSNYRYFTGTDNAARKQAASAGIADNFGKLTISLPMSEGAGTNLLDVSGHGYNGYISPGTSTKYWYDGKFSYASGDLSNNIYGGVIAANPWEMKSGWTVCSWFMSTNKIDGSHLITPFSKGNSGSTNADFSCSFYSSANRLYIDLVSMQNGVWHDYATNFSTAITANDGNWHFIAMGNDGLNPFIFLDGIIYPLLPANGPCPNAGNIGIGRYTLTSDFRMYCPSLTTNELAKLYEKGRYVVTDSAGHINGNATGLTNFDKTAVLPSIATNLAFVTPEMFGAVGNGVANDTAAVQAAVTYSSRKNITLKCLKSYYLTDAIHFSSHTTIEGPYNNVEINGTSLVPATFLAYGTNAFDCFGVDSIRIIGCKIIGNTTSNLTTGTYAVRFGGSNPAAVPGFLELDHCTLAYFDYGLLITNADVIKINRCSIGNNHHNVYANATFLLDVEFNQTCVGGIIDGVPTAINLSCFDLGNGSGGKIQVNNCDFGNTSNSIINIHGGTVTFNSCNIEQAFPSVQPIVTVGDPGGYAAILEMNNCRIASSVMPAYVFTNALGINGTIVLRNTSAVGSSGYAIATSTSGPYQDHLYSFPSQQTVTNVAKGIAYYTKYHDPDAFTAPAYQQWTFSELTAGGGRTYNLTSGNNATGIYPTGSGLYLSMCAYNTSGTATSPTACYASTILNRVPEASKVLTTITFISPAWGTFLATMNYYENGKYVSNPGYYVSYASNVITSFTFTNSFSAGSLYSPTNVIRLVDIHATAVTNPVYFLTFETRQLQ